MMAACVVMGVLALYVPPSSPLVVDLEVSPRRVGMGLPVTLAVRVTDATGAPQAGARVLPYVNGRRWGHHDYTDERGRATLIVPLPEVQRASITVTAEPAPQAEPEQWIWAGTPQENQTVYLQGSIDLPDRPTEAELWVAVDDQAQIWVNGREVASISGWTDRTPLTGMTELLRPGRNTVAVAARNGTGPAGLLVRGVFRGSWGESLLLSGEDWHAYTAEPRGWPTTLQDATAPTVAFGDANSLPWSKSMTTWPGLQSGKLLFTDAVLTQELPRSRTRRVLVEARGLDRPPADPEHLVGMQWEPWFTPLACDWSTAQAVPLIGFYRSDDPRVIRQHMIWMMEMGVDFLIADWTNHLWDKQHWSERPPAAQSIVDATTASLNVMAEMRDEGLPVPKMVLYPGLNNGPSTTMTAINEELRWIHEEYIQNPRYQGLFLEYLGKPLVIIHNGSGPAGVANATEPLDDRFFTVRWHSSQHQANHLNEQGYWSWMDGVLEQPVTYFQGEPECLTVSVGFFNLDGWTYPDAYGRRNGWTFVESFKGALAYRPRFIELHQFNEFAGQPEGEGYGPNRDHYYDSYSVELSDDIEPVSLTTPAYRGQGGWGYLYLNLTKALVDLYRQDPHETTVLALNGPRWGSTVAENHVELQWTWVGKPPSSLALEVNGVIVEEPLVGSTYRLDLSKVPPGDVRVRLIARGAVQRYELSHTADSRRLTELAPATVELRFRRVP